MIDFDSTSRSYKGLLNERQRIAKNAPEKTPFDKALEASGVHYALIRAGLSYAGGH